MWVSSPWSAEWLKPCRRENMWSLDSTLWFFKRLYLMCADVSCSSSAAATLNSVSLKQPKTESINCLLIIVHQLEQSIFVSVIIRPAEHQMLISNPGMYECVYVLGNISKANWAILFTALQPARAAWHFFNTWWYWSMSPNNCWQTTHLKKAGAKGLPALT